MLRRRQNRLKTVIRRNRITDASRRENTAEHSWHLALFAMVLQEYAIAAVDVWRVVQMRRTPDNDWVRRSLVIEDKTDEVCSLPETLRP